MRRGLIGILLVLTLGLIGCRQEPAPQLGTWDSGIWNQANWQ